MVRGGGMVVLLLAACSAVREPRLFVDWGAVVWRGEVRLPGSFLVASGEVLRIEGGSVVRFGSPQADLVVEGVLLCDGTEREPVRFVGLGSNRVVVKEGEGGRVVWAGFDGVGLELRRTCRVEHVRVFRLVVRGEAGEVVRPEVRSSLVGLMVCEGGAAPRVTACRFDRAGFVGGGVGVKNIELSGVSEAVVTNCAILGDSAAGVPAGSWTVVCYSSGPTDLRRNWWGTPDSAYVTNTLLFRAADWTVLWLPVKTAEPPAPAVP